MDQKQVIRTYVGRSAAAMVLYIVILIAVVVLVRFLPETNWNILLAILPAIPLLYGLWSYGRFLDGVDEMQRLIHSKAIILAVGLVSVLTFTYGLLESFAGFPAISLLWVFPLLTTLWGFAHSYYAWKYG
jgi:hypothetical protein